MKKKTEIFSYCAFFLITLIIDRITKKLALIYAQQPIEITSFLSFDLVFNKGITGGMLQAKSMYAFVALTVSVLFISVALAYYMYQRWKYNNYIIGEVLTLSGAVSNIFDRFMYEGVIDFIHISFFGWSFPIFNLADVYIVMGVFIMFLIHIKE
jgi:signal peptidase II